jgi:hypothetical protein
MPFFLLVRFEWESERARDRSLDFHELRSGHVYLMNYRAIASRHDVRLLFVIFFGVPLASPNRSQIRKITCKRAINGRPPR